MTITAKDLKDQQFFSSLDDWYLEQLARYAETIRVEAGKMIFKEGDPAENFYLIKSGHIQLELTQPDITGIEIEQLGAGNVLGWSWLIPPHFWRLSAKTLSSTELIVFNGKYLRTKCDEDSQLGYAVMKRYSHVLVDRLLSTRLQLVKAVKENEMNQKRNES